MKKPLIILSSVAALGIIGVIALTFFLGHIVTAGVNTFAPKLTQTQVSLASARVSPLTGSGTLNGLIIGNPNGWSRKNLCSIETIHLSVDPVSLLSDHIVINEIEFEAPLFNYETRIVASNVNDLLKAIEAAKIGVGIKFEVKKLRLSNGKVRLGATSTGMTLPLPDIELTNLGTKEGGITPDQLVFTLMDRVTSSIVGATTQAAGDIGKTTGAAAAEGTKKTVESIKKFFGGKK